ncbi:hypothetical protein ANN_23783 [Periplaneta americana]|uniref:Mutator-like transposase domain-containing protein n=1 Tax=Periplaneta americana TaxID=6978 RepID=A0ABQ8SM03_PERAM|nr:hypothetical protein ANN_23783 [Periplaneta americana]
MARRKLDTLKRSKCTKRSTRERNKQKIRARWEQTTGNTAVSQVSPPTSQEIPATPSTSRPIEYNIEPTISNRLHHLANEATKDTPCEEANAPHIHNAGTNAAGSSLAQVREEIRKAYQELQQNNDIIDIGVSYDGSWQKRKKDLGKDSPEFYFWKESHKSKCKKNYEGSSSGMEVTAAEILWRRSVKCGFRYTTMLSDGDSKTFLHLQKAKIYESVELKKGRMHQPCGQDIKNIPVAGCQTTQAWWEETWESDRYSHYQTATVLQLTSNALLERCLEGRTQNCNECLHSMIWNRCPKNTFISKSKVDLAVASAVTEFNLGYRHMISNALLKGGMSLGGMLSKNRKSKGNQESEATPTVIISKVPLVAKQHKLGGKKPGSLTATVITKLQRYYSNAIRDNIKDLHAMKTAILATLYHCSSTDSKPNHSKCPIGLNTWCFFNKATALGISPGFHQKNIHTPLSIPVLQNIIPLYKRLTSNALLERCLEGRTQNCNECLHSMIWNRCPKNTFISKSKVDLAVASAVTEFNLGYRHMISNALLKGGMSLGGMLSKNRKSKGNQESEATPTVIISKVPLVS